MSLVALADFVLENYERADRLLEVLVRRAHDTGRLFLLAFALVGRTELSFRRGRWAEASANVATDEWGLAAPLPGMGSWLHAVQARIEAGLGLTDDAREHATAALVGARATDTRAIEAWAQAALGFLELGSGARGRRRAPRGGGERCSGGAGSPSPGSLVGPRPHRGALAPRRRRAGPPAHLEVLQRRADATGRRWAQAVAARGAGSVGDAPDRSRRPSPGGALARPARRPVRAGPHRPAAAANGGARSGWPTPTVPLERARAVFVRLDAQPWVAQADAVTGARAAPPSRSTLTRQERQVAAIVGRGHTNREAADALFVSAKTVDFHLRNIYKKLGLRSRTELAVWIADHEDQLLPP